MKLRLRYAVILAFAVMAVWIGLYPVTWQGWLGFTRAAYFTQGQNYALFSGFLPCFLTAIGLTSIFVTLLRHLNCHVDGCPRMSRHKIANGEHGVCGRHWLEISGHPPDHKLTIDHLRERHHLYLGDRPGPG